MNKIPVCLGIVIILIYTLRKIRFKVVRKLMLVGYLWVNLFFTLLSRIHLVSMEEPVWDEKKVSTTLGTADS